jgi:hypothetical protein
MWHNNLMQVNPDPAERRLIGSLQATTRAGPEFCGLKGFRMVDSRRMGVPGWAPLGTGHRDHGTASSGAYVCQSYQASKSQIAIRRRAFNELLNQEKIVGY